MLLVVIPDNIVNDGPGTTFTGNVLFVYLFLPGLSDRPVLGSCDVPSLHVSMFTAADVVPFSLMEVDGTLGLV